MHEVSLVAELIAECERRASGRPVRLVRVRHASSVPEPALRQAFQMLTEGGDLADATLETETFDVLLQCGCGFAGALGHDDLISGSVAVCPACGEASTLHRTAELELLEVRMMSTSPLGVLPIEGAKLQRASAVDAPEILVLQRCCWVDEAIANDTLDIPALHETLDDVRAWLDAWTTWCVRVAGRLVGAVRARQEGSSWEIGRLMVAPDLAGRGLGGWLLRLAEAQAPADVESITMFTGSQSARNIAMYERAGFRRTLAPAPPNAVRLVKDANPGRQAPLDNLAP